MVYRWHILANIPVTSINLSHDSWLFYGAIVHPSQLMSLYSRMLSNMQHCRLLPINFQHTTFSVSRQLKQGLVLLALVFVRICGHSSNDCIVKAHFCTAHDVGRHQRKPKLLLIFVCLVCSCITCFVFEASEATQVLHLVFLRPFDCSLHFWLHWICFYKLEYFLW